MPTVKLVVIGSSGVGKTSLRGKYIEGHFSTGYRATIGADFITKVLPHPTDPEQSVTLQIWDTAGQERFSSLSTAFFRGADAALLMFDVNTPETMHSLKKWWADFCDRAPLADGDVDDYCCVVVGNKIDMAGKGRGLVSESEALEFVDELVPLASSGGVNGGDEGAGMRIEVLPPNVSNGAPEMEYQSPPAVLAIPPSGNGNGKGNLPSRSPSIAIHPKLPPPFASSSSLSLSSVGHNHNHHRHASGSGSGGSLSTSPKHQLFKSRSRSSSRFYPGTMTTTHTTLTIYHTPSSSVFDVYQSARSSPEPWAAPEPPQVITTPAATPVGVGSAAGSPTQMAGAGLAPRQRTLTMLSTGSTSSGSAPTITPSLIAREREAAQHGAGASPIISSPLEGSTSPSPSPINGMPPCPPERGPRLFFTSAKTGEGVSDVFEYIARRVVQKWAYDEWVEARTMHFREASGVGGGGGSLGNGSGGGVGSATVRLLQGQGRWEKRKMGDCCAS
ncbi:ras-domain-containing protein [Pholiota conissans]|uniref:Ras-domain-containing protein n=1 Tax=Pholiota conissans TaxID=109636 RepID=A0A9P5Z4Q5_9AGAR|nr:ras-domain-containing protein [Pholiota conissans]